MDKRVVPGRYVPTGTQHDVWVCGVCGFRGTTGTWRAPDGSEGLFCYRCCQGGVKSALRVERQDDLRWECSTVEVKCCGVWLLCDEFTNTCPRCERDYNGSGQLLAPRSQWGEETGETAADVLRVRYDHVLDGVPDGYEDCG